MGIHSKRLMKGLPHQLVSEMVDQGENNRMSEGDSCLRTSGREGEEDAWSEDIEENRYV